ncbi:MAG: branched-chain amino acid ABC transporter substrate-binding protein, partial [Deltaproteobacteria bacterium]|nr:branched-chain amino acid ABC transporter substrate-binding protein [Deltaproteobacteria bacterium]
MRSTTEIILRVTLALALALAVFSAAEATAQEDPIRIGVMGPTTGPWASEGQDMLNVVIILADELNQAGGINGRKVEIFAADDGGNPKTATLATQQLIADEVVAVVGTYGSNVTEATQDIYSEAGIVQIATGSTAVRLSEKGLERFFRTCPRDDEQGKVMAQHVRDLGFKKVAIVHDNTSYSKG